MTIAYTLDEDDFLTHQLFLASKSERIKRKRKRSKQTVPLIYLVVGLLFLISGKISLAILFFIIGFLWFFTYPLWERNYYVDHYRGFIKENYQDRLGRLITMEFNHEYILAKDNGSESKVMTSELEEIWEIPASILIRLKGGQSFIIPKDKIKDYEGLKAGLKELARHLNIPYNIDEKWVWK